MDKVLETKPLAFRSPTPVYIRVGMEDYLLSLYSINRDGESSKQED